LPFEAAGSTPDSCFRPFSSPAVMIPREENCNLNHILFIVTDGIDP
jgi:hypothetical protein